MQPTVLLRWFSVLLRDPKEALDRVSIRRRASRTPTLDRTAPSFDGRGCEWSEELHSLLGTSWPCTCGDQFSTAWDSLGPTPATQTATATDHDADIVLAQALHVICSHRPPRTAVETGVGRGVTSRIILEAMSDARDGQLWSVDLPPLADPWFSASRSMVPPTLHQQWTYVRGSSRRVLAPTLVESGPLDLFLHDSLHTAEHVTFELETVRDWIRPGGFIVADDIEGHRALEDVLQGWDFMTISHARKGGVIGIARRPIIAGGESARRLDDGEGDSAGDY
jgi:predicted O-methyltransferase YrrM